MPRAHKPLQPLTTTYEWGGPLGAGFMMIFLPTLVITLNSLCDSEQCSIFASVPNVPNLVRSTIVGALPSLPCAMLIEGLWLAAHALLYLCPVGKVVKGMALRNGEVLEYRLNAIHAFFVSHVVIFALHYAGIINLAILADLLSSLMLGAIIISAFMSVVLYIASYRSPSVLTALGGNSGSALYDMWIGRELNPRTGFLDWKFMCELRPGLIGWSVLNWAFVMKAVQLGNFTPSIALIALFESFYVFDGLLLEVGNLTMMDIVYDGFGFMLCFGDLAWVPFTYTLQTKYLAYNPEQVSIPYLVLCIMLIVIGYAIFRGANTQKDRFRSNPSDVRVEHLRVMKTSKGKSLIISGFWGVCRHPNYVGDWLMSLGWAALAGTGALMPFFHPIYFGALLMYRQLRDEKNMREKYGDEDWERFCRLVPARLFPGIY